MNLLRVQNKLNTVMINLCIGLHTVCIVSNCCLSLYLNIGGLREGPGKTF